MHSYVSPSQSNIQYCMSLIGLLKPMGCILESTATGPFSVSFSSKQSNVSILQRVSHNPAMFCSLQSYHRNSEKIWKTNKQKISEWKRGSVALFCVKRGRKRLHKKVQLSWPHRTSEWFSLGFFWAWTKTFKDTEYGTFTACTLVVWTGFSGMRGNN